MIPTLSTPSGVVRYGRIAERFKALVLKTSEVAIPPWVRTPLRPPTQTEVMARLEGEL